MNNPDEGLNNVVLESIVAECIVVEKRILLNALNLSRNSQKG